MIFPKPLDRLVVEGRKTQTRVRVQIRDDTIRPCYYQPGHSYVVQRTAGGAELGRVEVLSVRRSLLSAITLADARAEGWRTVAEFADHWMGRHGDGWPPVAECALCAGARPDCAECAGSGVTPIDVSSDDVMARWATRSALLVWVITFRPDDVPRLLAAGAGASAERYRTLPSGRQVVAPREDDKETDLGYTTNVARALSGTADAGEAIDADLLDIYTEDARERHAGRSGIREDQLRRRARSLANRLRDAAVSAERSGIDVRVQLEQVEAAIRLLEGQRQEAA